VFAPILPPKRALQRARIAALGALTWLGACFEDVSEPNDEPQSSTSSSMCMVGAETCGCYPNGTCNDGLTCLSEFCVRVTGDATGGTGTGSSFTSASTPTSDGTETGADPTSTTLESQDASGEDATTAPDDLPAQIVANADGWTSRTENLHGFQGAWFTFTSPFGATISPTPAWTPTTLGEMCVSGTVDQVPCTSSYSGIYEGCDYENYWGAGAGLHLCAPDADQDPPPDGEVNYTISECPWADLADLRGFSFRIAGQVPPDTRVVFRERDYVSSPYVVVHSTAVTALFQDAQYFTDRLLEVENIVGLELTLSASPAESRSFDFCIYDLTPLF